MARITILGGTGYAGAALAAEAAARGHHVTAVSRTAPVDPLAEVEYVAGSVLDAAALDDVLPGRDVVISALSPRGERAGRLEGVLEELARRLDGTSSGLDHLGLPASGSRRIRSRIA